LAIRSKVFDVRAGLPKPGARIFVDTNVWDFVLFDEASAAQLVQGKRIEKNRLSFGTFLDSAKKDDGAKLFTSNIVRMEMVTVYERHQAELALLDHDIKEFRRERPAERADALKRAHEDWGTIESLAEVLPCPVEPDFMETVYAKALKYSLDQADAVSVCLMADNGIEFVLTDDKDFLAVDGISVITVDEEVIRNAKHQGCLHAPAPKPEEDQVKALLDFVLAQKKDKRKR